MPYRWHMARQLHLTEQVAQRSDLRHRLGGVGGKPELDCEWSALSSTHSLITVVDGALNHV